MSHDLFKKQVYAGVLEILKDEKYFHHSRYGHNYCKLTEEGAKELLDYFAVMGPWILDREQREMDNQAKQLVIKGLKQ